jgi:hypothetical protein
MAKEPRGGHSTSLPDGDRAASQNPDAQRHGPSLVGRERPDTYDETRE